MSNNKNLTAEQKSVLFEENTEPPGSSKLNNEKREGSYHCVNCGVKLFDSKAKFSWDEIYSKIIPYFDNSLSSLDQVFLADINGKLLYNWIPLNTSFHKFFN